MPSVNRAGPMNPMKPFLEKRPSPRLSGPKLLGGLILFGLCVTLHAQLSCTVDGFGSASVRAEGFSERTGDIVIHCHGGTPLADGTPLPTVNITVYLNATITSRIYSNGWSEVLLLVDNPGGNFNYVPSTPLACNDPNGICPITGRGNGQQLRRQPGPAQHIPRDGIRKRHHFYQHTVRPARHFGADVAHH